MKKAFDKGTGGMSWRCPHCDYNIYSDDVAPLVEEYGERILTESFIVKCPVKSCGEELHLMFFTQFTKRDGFPSSEDAITVDQSINDAIRERHHR